MDRRDFLAALGRVGAGALLGGGLLGACAEAATQPTTEALLPTSFGYIPITDATPILLADAAGIYAENGLDVLRPSRYRSWPEVTQALHRGLVDFSHLLMPLAIRLRFETGLPLKVLAWTHTGGSALTVRNGIDTVEDLAGGVVAIPNWHSIQNVIIQILLRRSGLEPRFELDADGAAAHHDHVHLMVMAPPDMPDALSAGTIDGFVVPEPFNARAELTGTGRILRFTSDIWREHACCVLVASEDLVTERPDVAQRAVDSIVAGQLRARRDLPAAALALSTDGGAYLNDSLETINRALGFYAPEAYPTSIQNVAWATDRVGFRPFPFRSFTDRLVEQMGATRFETGSGFLGDTSPVDVHDELVDDRFVRRAISRLDPENTFGLPADLSRTEDISA